MRLLSRPIGTLGGSQSNRSSSSNAWRNNRRRRGAGRWWAQPRQLGCLPDSDAAAGQRGQGRGDCRLAAA
jgi:hypothetical protein